MSTQKFLYFILHPLPLVLSLGTGKKSLSLSLSPLPPPQSGIYTHWYGISKPFLQAVWSQLPHPLLIQQILQPFNHFHSPALDSLRFVPISVALGRPGLDTGLQMWCHQCWTVLNRVPGPPTLLCPPQPGNTRAQHCPSPLLLHQAPECLSAEPRCGRPVPGAPRDGLCQPHLVPPRFPELGLRQDAKHLPDLALGLTVKKQCSLNPSPTD